MVKVDHSWRTGQKANRDPKLHAIRSATTNAHYKYGMGGLKKEGQHAPKKITLPKMPWDDEKETT